ncbi:MAG: quinoprotein relay system zinc metallohydrolase 2 [Methylococcaceae bacterium]|nr:quinoprotein relay system zinc metallohydrolase 2 [Methylococcaceae bacterium]
MNKLFYFSFSILLTISTAFACEGYAVKKVSSGIYYHQGVHEEPSESNIGAIANVGFIVGERCVAVIDSGGSYLEGTYLRQAVKNKTDLPICYVINTHVHPDHIFGNAAFKDDSPIFVGHEKLPAAIAAREEFFAKTFKETLGEAYTGTEFISPTQTASIDKPITIDLGNRILTLTAYSTSHTDHDLTVLDNKTKTLWTGDLLFMGRIPVMDGSINGWIETMTQMQTMELNFLIPGHGEASSDKWQHGLKKQLDYFTLIRDEIRIIIEDFGTIDQASKQVGILEQNSWELFEHYHRRNVTSSFVQLEWE